VAIQTIQKLSDLHKRMLDALFLGRRIPEIMEEFKVSRNTVSLTKNSPVGQEYLLEKQQKSEAELFAAKQRIIGGVHNAIDCLLKSVKRTKIRLNDMENKDVRITPSEKQCIDTILKYAGLEPEQGLAGKQWQGLFTADDIERFKTPPAQIPAPKEPPPEEEDVSVIEAEIVEETVSVAQEKEVSQDEVE